MIPPEIIGRILRLEEQLRTNDEWNREQDRRIKRAEGGVGGGGVSSSGEGAGGLVRFQTTSALAGRSGTTAGTGTGVLVDFDGTNYANTDAIGLRNISATAFDSGKYGWAQRYDEGVYEVVSCEC
jgi:hypothetical protein